MPSETKHAPPGHYGAASYDLTGHVGPKFPQAVGTDWPMYSFDRPSTILWNAIGKTLFAGGWSDDKIREWLQSTKGEQPHE